MSLDSLTKHLLPDLARHWRLELNKTEACLQRSEEDEEDCTLEGQEPQLYTKHLERTEEIPFSFPSNQYIWSPKHPSVGVFTQIIGGGALPALGSPILEAMDAPIG